MEMPELADENIFDILSWLPAKSLMRFKCVSKPWCSLISDPQFIKAHASRLDQMSSKILLTTEPRATIINFEDFDNLIVELNYPVVVQTSTWFIFVGSCDGLVCLLLNSYFSTLWNPFTREFRLLPPPIPSNIYDPDGIFDSAGYYHFYGFGYDSSIDDYKLVVGCWSKSSVASYASEYCVVQVLALKSNEWKFITFHKLGYYFTGRSILLNGNLHWISEDDSKQKPKVVLSFNMKEEKFMEVVQFPMDWQAESHQTGLYAFENSLILFTRFSNADGSYFEVWKKNTDAVQGYWEKLYRVLVQPASSYQLYFTKKHKLVLGVIESSICIYDLEAMTYKVYHSNNAHFLDVIVYLETLVSPN